ncbi:MAG: DUF86 domain-containing protein [Cyclobacteriaceae bacterium]
MNPKVLKYLLDIESVISEIESIKERINNNFSNFQSDFLVKRATERDLEIIGEAMNKLIQLEPTLEISGSKKIVGLRNLIIHAYDSIDDELLWAIIQRDIPKLSKEINELNG